MAANHGLQLSHALTGGSFANHVGTFIECKLTGANESPVISDLTLKVSSIQFSYRKNTAQSFINLVVPGGISQVADITARGNGDLIIDIYAVLADNSRSLITSYNLNYDQIRTDEGPRNQSATLIGRKFISDEGSGVSRTISKWITKFKSPSSGNDVITYSVPAKNIKTMKPGDLLDDGTDSGTIQNIVFSMSAGRLNATIEVQ